MVAFLAPYLVIAFLLSLIFWILRQHAQERETVYAALIARTPGQFVAVQKTLKDPEQVDPREDTSHLEPIGFV